MKRGPQNNFSPEKIEKKVWQLNLVSFTDVAKTTTGNKKIYGEKDKFDNIHDDDEIIIIIIIEVLKSFIMVTSPTTPKGLTNGSSNTNASSAPSATESRVASALPSPSSNASISSAHHQINTNTTPTGSGTNASNINTSTATNSGPNRLTPNISVNLVHHLHPNVSRF